MRSVVVEDIRQHLKRTRLSLDTILYFYNIRSSTYYGWFDEHGDLRSKEPRIPQNDRKVLPDEVEAVVAYRKLHPDLGYRKLTYQMMDENICALSETAVYNILSAHNLLQSPSGRGEPASKEYRHKPKYVHHHWHTDIAYIKVAGHFYFLIMMLDGYSRYLLDWELMPDMLGSSVENFVARVKEKYPEAKPMLIHDNGSQFISLDFKSLCARIDIKQVRARRNHPETNGKIERLNKSVKHEAIYPQSPQSYPEAWEILNDYAYQYNHQRLHTGIHYLRPSDMFFGRGKQILLERERKMEVAKTARREANRKLFEQQKLH
jgi:putative transposase